MLRRLLADALIASGGRAERGGRLAAACGRYRTAAAVAPGYAPALLNLGAALEAAGDKAAAERAYRDLLAAQPADAFASYNLGRLHHARGDLGEAERLLRQALRGKPDFADALVALAHVQEACGEQASAVTSLEQALAVRADFAGTWYNYGVLLWQLGRFDEAETALRRALALEPRFVPAWHLLGNMLRGVSRIADALEAFAAARRLEPERFDLESMELQALTLADGISAQDLFARHRAFGARLEAAIAPRFGPWTNDRNPERRLRVGFVSGDFHNHPVSWYAIPLLERMDRAQYQVFCYSTGSRLDGTTQQVRHAADVWRDVAALPDAGIADAIARDEIDVLVDLAGHSGVSRLGIFAMQPAPVQASWLGYPNTTGLTRIRYRLSDATADPPGMTEHLHTETLLRLPVCQWCFRPFFAERHAPEPPCARNGFVTFGSFNHAPKLSATARRLWAGILRLLPASRLLVVGVPDGRPREDLLRDFAAGGVSASRLTVIPRGQYYNWFDAADVALDTMPYGGGATTFDALWMGVPVVTLAGTRTASRSAASILAALGLREWIAASEEDYVGVATAAAADPGRIASLRASLRERMAASPLMDEARFARDMETACRDMWRAWCARPMS